jgi:hypothetical protein
MESFETESDSCLNLYQVSKNTIPKKTKSIKPLKSKSLSNSYIAEEDPNRCWFFFSNILLCQKSLSKILIDYKMDKGNNTYKIGNEFSCYLIGLSKIHYKCIESKNNDYKKIISWIMNIDIGFLIRKQYSIYPISNNNSSLIKGVLEIIQPDNDESVYFADNKEYFYENQNSIMLHKIKLMTESLENRYIQESFIAKCDFETSWKTIINFQLLSEIVSGKIGERFQCNGNPEKVGSFWKCYLKDLDRIVYFKVIKIVKNKKRNRWIYRLKMVGVGINMIKHELEINLTKINKNSNQISILIIFNDFISKQLYDCAKSSFIEIMKKIKSFINKNGH